MVFGICGITRLSSRLPFPFPDVKGLHWLPVSDDHWHPSAEVAFELRRKGITTSVIDTLIAALAIDYDCTPLHKDFDFDQIARHAILNCYPLL